MRARHRRLVAALAAALTTAAVALTTAPTATASTPATAASAAKGQLARGPIRSGDDPIVFSKPNGLGTMDVITCTGSSDYPHNSSGTPSAVTGKSRSYCTAPIAEMRVQGDLWRYLEGYGYAHTGFGSLVVVVGAAATLPSTAYDICQGRLAYWRTVGTHTFYAPPGYSPPSISFKTETPPVGVNC